MRRPFRRSRATIGILVAIAVMAALGLGSGCITYNGTLLGTADPGGVHLVVFGSDRGRPAGQNSLFLWDADSQAVRAMPGITTDFSEHNPTITSDGLYVAFEGDHGSGENIYLYYRGAPERGIFAIDSVNTSEPESEPCFTGDGKMLAYVRGSSVRRVRLYDNGTKRSVDLPGLYADGVSSDYSPSPNYDGSLIAFVSTRNGNPDIFIYSRPLRRVLDLPKLQPLRSAGDDIEPCFTPSGRYLAFASNRAGGAGGYDLYLMDFAPVVNGDTTLVRLDAADTRSDERNPAISENGLMVVFQSNRPEGWGRWDLWTYDRASGVVGQGRNLPSIGDDVEPALKWRY